MRFALLMTIAVCAGCLAMGQFGEDEELTAHAAGGPPCTIMQPATTQAELDRLRAERAEMLRQEKQQQQVQGQGHEIFACAATE